MTSYPGILILSKFNKNKLIGVFVEIDPINKYKECVL